jgi:hypothetical protein
MYPPGLSRLEILPNELKLLIINHIDTRSQASLACVSKAIQPVVEDVLYKLVWIEKPNTQKIVLPIASFVRTIISRPDLAHKVKQVAVGFNGLQVSADLDDLYEIPLPNTTTATKVEARLDQSDLVKAALLRLPSVERMFINTLHLHNQQLPSGPHLCTLQWESSIWYPGSVPAFANLTTLHWTERVLPFRLVCLPQLRTLFVSRKCSFKSPGDVTDTPNITSLIVQCYFAMIMTLPDDMDSLWVSYRKRKSAMFEVLERCIFLTDLSIAFYHHTEKFHLLSGTNPGNLSKFVSELNESLPGLKSLAIGPLCHTGYGCLRNIEPIDSLKDFVKLQHLKLAHQMFPGCNEEYFPGNLAVLRQLLPTSIKTIEIDLPTGDIFRLLDQFLQEDHGLHRMKNIVVRCATKSHTLVTPLLIAPEVILQKWNCSPIIQRLLASKFSLKLECMTADYTSGFPCYSNICDQCRDVVVWEEAYETSSANLAAFVASLPGSSVLDVSDSYLEIAVPC